MGKLKDLTGLKFGRLTVIERAGSKNGFATWRCKCDCGNIHIVSGVCLTSGASKSCGCLQREITQKRATTHGKSHTKLYYIWRGIKCRCFNVNDAFFIDYGGRGISIYPEWIDNFQAFYDYVSTLENFGKEGCSLDRINNNGNYEPNNLRWANASEQQRNSRQNRFVNFNGDEVTVVEAAEKSGISESVLRS
ncbi:MAG: hypothetical protein IJT73_06890 [Selenomonadaceae bacterium]|nr:hypothetical protein [Selenomonadaceae bacterium]